MDNTSADPGAPSSPLVAAGATLAVAAAAALYLARRARGRRRGRGIAAADERVCIVGASSGVGRALALQYAARGARVCVVARRAELVAALAAECGGEDRCIGAVADAGRPDDVARVRAALLDKWGGLDTLHVCAGVSALQPVMALTGARGPDEDPEPADMQRAVDVAARATQGNFVGPLVAALAMIPMLQRTSTAPAILLVSSLAAVVGAPTRALYASTKASSLLLYQSLAIEHPRIAFSFVLPSTIEGNFRASAVDAGPVREDDPNKTGLKIDYVAQRCVDAVDRQATGNTFLPRWPYFLAPLIYTLLPSYVEDKARKKYHWEAH